MIWESWYWKQPLLEMADRLEHLKTASALSDEELAQVERDIFIGFYSVRKLLEALPRSPTRPATVLSLFISIQI